MTDMQHIEKKSFTLDSFQLESGVAIPVTLGYETYGELNADKSNVILISHYFSASSHAAGKYDPSDPLPGYWDAMIGPGKDIDTDKYFVISTDNLCNVQWYNPKVITTGPRSINPKTGKRYGMTFPASTYKDQAGIQKRFLAEQLGINHLYAVMGASAGGMISFHWAVHFPDMMDKMIGVITNAQTPVLTAFNVCQHAMRVLALDPAWKNGDYEDDERPTESLLIAIQLMNVGAFTEEYYEQVYPRDLAETAPYTDVTAKNSFETSLNTIVSPNLKIVDPSHWYYTARTTMQHSVARDYGSMEAALDRIKAQVLLVSSVTDYLMPTSWNQKIVDHMTKAGKKCELVKIYSNKGHMAGVFDTVLFGEAIKEFLAR